MSALNVRVLHAHTNTPDFDYHEMVQIGPAQKRDSLGRKHPTTWRQWLPFQCNNTECLAEAIVEAASIARAIEDLVPAAPLVEGAL